MFQAHKMFSIFSQFRNTRVLVRSVVEIIKDMVPFVIFVTAATVVFALLFTSAVD